MKKITGLILLLGIIVPLGSQESSNIISVQDIPGLLRGENLKWHSLDREKQLREYQIRRNKWTFRPDLTLSLSPAYGVASTINTTSHSVGFSLGSKWLLPSDGTLSVTLSDITTFSNSSGASSVSQNPSIQFSYTQPFWVNGKLLAPKLYRYSRAVSLDLPAQKSSFKTLSERNTLIRSTVSLFATADQNHVKLTLKTKERDLREQDLYILDQKRHQGLVSGNAYWKSQLEYSNTEDLLLEIRFESQASTDALAAALGIEGDVNLSNEVPRLHLLPAEDEALENFETLNPELINLRSSQQEQQMNEALSGKANGGSLSLALNFTPSVPPGSTTATNFGDSVSRYFNSGARLNPSFTISYSTSLSGQAKSRIDGQMTAVSDDNRRIEYQRSKEQKGRLLSSLYNKREMLIAKKSQIEENLAYLEKMLEKEQALRDIASSTALEVGWAEWNRDSRMADLNTVRWEILQNRLDIGTMIGEDLSLLLEKGNS